MRLLSALLIISGMFMTTGCSMCATGYLDDYATVGGKWQRSDPTQGRVGSIFSDAGETVSHGMIDDHYREHPAQSFEGEAFGEAYIEGYETGIEEYHEFGELSADGSYQEFHDGDTELTLSDGW